MIKELGAATLKVKALDLLLVIEIFIFGAGPILLHYTGQRFHLTMTLLGWSCIILAACGVHQGSILGPFLFVQFINNIDLASSSILVRKFANDTKLGQILKDLFPHYELQNSLNNLVKWSETWNTQFNVQKKIQSHLYLKNNMNHRYSNQGHILESVSEEKDVGVACYVSFFKK